MDWNRFKFKHHIKYEGLIEHLITIDGYKEAALNLYLPVEWKEKLDRLNRIRSVHGTTAVEGNPLSESEVAEQIELVERGALDTGELTREQVQIRNADRAQQWVRNQFSEANRPLREEHILHMHKLLTQGSDESSNVPGEYRRHNVVAGTSELGGVHRGAPHETISKLMREFVELVNSREISRGFHPVVGSLIAHFYLVTLHPFGDGNGRASRLVEASLLHRDGYNVHGFYGLSNYFYRNRDDYIRLLQESRRTQPFELTPFVEFGLKGFGLELKGINTFIKARLNRLMYKDTLLGALVRREGQRRRVISQREYSLLSFLLEETEPAAPFSDEPSRSVTFEDLLNSAYIRALYQRVKPRAFRRELLRLFEKNFISLEQRNGTLEVTLDFSAIGRY